MTPREIVAEAWAITMRERSIRGWSFTSSFCETLLKLKLLLYQFYFMYKYFQTGTGAGFFDVELYLLRHIPFWAFLAFVIVFALAVAIEFFMPHLCLGAIIGLGAKAQRGEPVRGGLVLALYNFFPIFAIHEFLILSSFTTTITVLSLMLRYIDHPLKVPSIVGLLLVFAFSNILRFFFSFAEEGVVIEKHGVFVSFGRSFKFVISHLGHVMFLLLLLVVISLRIVLNAAMVIILPGVIIGLSFLLALFFSKALSYLIAGFVGIALVLVASYFFAYLHAFKQTVWTITYLEFLKHRDLDVILDKK